MAVRPDPAFCDPQLGEFILRYEDVRCTASPEQAILDFFESTYEAGARWRDGIALRLNGNHLDSPMEAANDRALYSP